MHRGKPMTLDSGEAEIAKSVKAGDLKIKAVASGVSFSADDLSLDYRSRYYY